MDIDNILRSTRISFGEKNYKYFIGYADEYRIKPFTIIHPKTSTYVKNQDDGATKWMYFLKNYLKNMIFGIKSAIV